MATKLVNKGNGIYEVTASINGKVWADAKDKALKRLASNVQIKGFRKGQAPLDLAKERINPQDLGNEQINVVLPKLFDDSCKENKLRPFVAPEVKVTKFSDTELEVVFTITVYPEVKLGQYKDIHLAQEVPSVTNAEVDEAIAKLLEDNSELVLKEGAAEKGDTVVFDFKGYIDGKEFDGGSSDNYSLVLGSNTFVPGFEDQLIGVTSETKKDVEVTFPDQYIKDLAGKKAKFACMIHEIKTKQSPKLEDEFVAGLKITDVNTVKALKEYEEKQILGKKAKDSKNKYMQDLIDQICKNSEVVIADAVIESEAKSLKENMIQQISQNGLTFEQYKEITGMDDAKLEVEFKGQAKNELVATVVVDKIAQVEGLIVSQKELDEFYENSAKMYNMKVEELKKMYASQQQQLVSNLLNRKILNFLEANNAPLGEKAVAEEKPAKEVKAKKTAAKKEAK